MKTTSCHFALAAMLTLAPLPAAFAQNAKAGTAWPAALSNAGGQAALSTFLIFKGITDDVTRDGFDARGATFKVALLQKLTEGTKDKLTDLVIGGSLSKDDEAVVQRLIMANDLLDREARALTALITQRNAANAGANDESLGKAGEVVMKFLESIGVQVPRG